MGKSMHRRDFLQAFSAAAALQAVLATRALAAVPAELDRWAKGIADLNRELSKGSIGQVAWQDGIAALDTGMDIAALARYLDFDRLTSAMEFPSRLAETVDPKFPATVSVAGIERTWFLRFFGMRKGGAIIPHVHNNMVSSHLVIQGSFHARTFDRMSDDTEARRVLLKQTRDGTLAAGEVITMSDDRDNGHWLLANEDRSFTFDIGMVSISKTREFALKANDYNMIFVDPTTKPDSKGLIEAPVLTFDACSAKFAG
jgi:hypothetical protein